MAALLVISDHGLKNRAGHWIEPDRFSDLSAFPREGIPLCASTESDAEKAYAHLTGASDKFVVPSGVRSETSTR